MSVDFFKVECPACKKVVWGNVYGRIRHHEGCDNINYTPTPSGSRSEGRTVRTLERRLVWLINTGSTEVTADDVTDCGNIAVDDDHSPNGKQSAIGSFFRQMGEMGVLHRSGRVIKSKAPKRKGGMIQVWEVTDVGRVWAGGFRRTIPRQT